MGSWVSYGLGSENQDMPGFVTICPTARMGGPQNYGNAFLPASYQGTAIGGAERPSKDANIKYLTNASLPLDEQERQFRLLQKLNRAQFETGPYEDEVAAAINSFELAWRMQNNAPDLMDLKGETKATRDLYGMDDPKTEDFGRQCLMARRMAEAGVRYIQVNYSETTAVIHVGINIPKWRNTRSTQTPSTNRWPDCWPT